MISTSDSGILKNFLNANFDKSMLPVLQHFADNSGILSGVFDVLKTAGARSFHAEYAPIMEKVVQDINVQLNAEESKYLAEFAKNALDDAGRAKLEKTLIDQHRYWILEEYYRLNTPVRPKPTGSHVKTLEPLPASLNLADIQSSDHNVRARIAAELGKYPAAQLLSNMLQKEMWEGKQNSTVLHNILTSLKNNGTKNEVPWVSAFEHSIAQHFRSQPSKPPLTLKNLYFLLGGAPEFMKTPTGPPTDLLKLHAETMREMQTNELWVSTKAEAPAPASASNTKLSKMPKLSDIKANLPSVSGLFAKNLKPLPADMSSWDVNINSNNAQNRAAAAKALGEYASEDLLLNMLFREIQRNNVSDQVVYNIVKSLQNNGTKKNASTVAALSTTIDNLMGRRNGDMGQLFVKTSKIMNRDNPDSGIAPKFCTKIFGP
jgi:hypothetical protein